MSDELRLKLDAFVLACNALRSSQRDAEGFVTGKRIYGLREAEKRAQAALLALAPWVEDQARAALGLSPTPASKPRPHARMAELEPWLQELGLIALNPTRS